MKKMMPLILTLLKVSVRLPARNRGIGLKVLGMLCLIPMVYGYFALLFSAYSPNRPETPLIFGVVLSQVMVLFFAITQIISTLFLAADLQLLLPLPYKPGQMMAAKTLVVLAGEYLIQMLFYIPPVLVYGLRAHPSFFFWPTFVVVFLVSPVLPLALAMVLVFLLQRLGLGRRLRDFWTVVASGLCMGFFVWFQLSMSETAGPGQITRMALKLLAVERFVPPIQWSVRAMVQAGRPSGALFLCAAVFFAALLGFFVFRLAQGLYYRGVLVSGGAPAGRLRPTAPRKPGRVRSAGRALFAREWALFWRTPFWVSGCFVPALMIGIVMVVPLFRTVRFGETFAWSPREACFAALGLALGITAIGSMNNIAVTVLSREGRKFWISGVIPVSPADQIKAKFAATQAILGLSLLPSIGAALLVLRLPVFYAVVAVTTGLLGAGLGQVFAIGLDISAPHLVWENPQEALRRGLSGMGSGCLTTLAMVVGVAIAAALVALRVKPAFIALAALAFVGIGRHLALRALLRNARRCYDRIEA